MNRKDIVKIILILKSSYPYAFKDMTEEETNNMVNLYEELFKDNDYHEVSKAILDLINTSEYLPTIASIKSKIYDNKHKKIDNNELWDSLVRAIGNSNYNSEEEFEKLPELVKLYVRSPQQLQDMATMDSDIVHSVVKGQFLKQIENIKQDYKESEIVGRKNNLLQEKGIYQLEEMEE